LALSQLVAISLYLLEELVLLCSVFAHKLVETVYLSVKLLELLLTTLAVPFQSRCSFLCRLHSIFDLLFKSHKKELLTRYLILINSYLWLSSVNEFGSVASAPSYLYLSRSCRSFSRSSRLLKYARRCSSLFLLISVRRFSRSIAFLRSIFAMFVSVVSDFCRCSLRSFRV